MEDISRLLFIIKSTIIQVTRVRRLGFKKKIKSNFYLYPVKIKNRSILKIHQYQKQLINLIRLTILKYLIQVEIKAKTLYTIM